MHTHTHHPLTGRGGVTMQYQHLTATYCIRYVHHVLTLNNTLAARHLQRCVCVCVVVFTIAVA